MTNNKKTRKMDLGMACIILLAAFAMQFIVQFFLALFPMSDAAYTWAVVISNQVILFCACLGFCLGIKVDFVELVGAKRPPKWYFFPLFILTAITCVLCFAPIAGLVTRMLEKVGYEVTPNYHLPMDRPLLFTFALLALSILPAIGEETAVRGVLLNGCRQKSPVFAIFISALVFALLHGNLTQIVHQFLLGIVAGYFVCVTHSIYAGVVIHFTNNLMAGICEYGFDNGWIDPRFYWYLCGESSAATTLIGICVAFFALILFIAFATLLLHRDRAEKEDFYPPMPGVFRNISPYLDYLAGIALEVKPNETDVNEDIQTGVSVPAVERRKIDKFGWIAFGILLGTLSLVVLLTLIPGGRG